MEKKMIMVTKGEFGWKCLKFGFEQILNTNKIIKWKNFTRDIWKMFFFLLHEDIYVSNNLWDLKTTGHMCMFVCVCVCVCVSIPSVSLWSLFHRLFFECGSAVHSLYWRKYESVERKAHKAQYSSHCCNASYVHAAFPFNYHVRVVDYCCPHWVDAEFYSLTCRWL